MPGLGPNTRVLLQLDSISLPATGAVSTGTPTLQLTPTPKDSASKTVKTGDYEPTYVWASDDETKATVDADGLVTKVAAGTANITASVTLPRHLGGATITSNECEVTVS